jgi:LemA protein
MTLWILLAVIVLVLLWMVGAYNGLVRRRNRMRNAWAQIDVQLKRRHDLIPNLVGAVRGALAHERGVLEAVTQARQAAVSAMATAGGNVPARAAAENELTRAVHSLFAVAEAYPEIRANQNVLALQEEISSTENKVAFARQFYNDSVQELNTACESFPTNLVAGPCGFQPAPMFELADAGERAVPEVRL